MKVNIYNLGEIPDEELIIAMIVSKYRGKNVYVRHRERKTYEIPGGHREPNETIEECAKRELMEETGATKFTIKPLFTLGVEKEAFEDYGQVYLAEIEEFSGELEYEMEEVVFLDGEPESYTYPAIQTAIINRLLLEDKLNEFLNIAKKLNDKNIVPLLMGSLGLEFVTHKNWNSRDIDIHIKGDPRGWKAPDDERIDDWESIELLMEELGYTLIDLHEHEFNKDNFFVEYGVIDTLPSFANVSLKELERNKIKGVEFYTPSMEGFLKIYLASSKDGYRAGNNNNKDFEKIEYLKEQLKIS